MPGGREAALLIHDHLTFFHETATDTAAAIVAQFSWHIIALDLIVVCTSGIAVKRSACVYVRISRQAEREFVYAYVIKLLAFVFI